MMNALIDNPTSDITLVHRFKDILPDVDEFFLADNDSGVVNTVNSLCNRIKKLADKYRLTIDPDKFKGDAFELFVEYFCKSNAGDNRVGIYGYMPVMGEDDVGVDGHGIGDNKYPSTVQAKFRAGDYVLYSNEDQLSNFLVSSWSDFGVRMEDDKNMLIITTGLKVDEVSREKMLKNKVRVLNREALREMLDHRPEWWTRFYSAVKASRAKKVTIQPQTLREHQQEAVDATEGKSKGKIILPTGTGKTRIEGELIRRTIINELAKGNTTPFIKVNSSRILLCFQLFEDIFKYLNSHGIQARYINFNSGKRDDSDYIEEMRKSGGVYREIVSTTTPFEVKIAYEKAKTERLPLIVISTYNSSEKCSECGIIPTRTIHDEGHNLVSSGDFARVAKLPSGDMFFLTATEKVTDSDDDLGMNNPKIFGETIYTKSPRYMIEKGEMVPPYVHIIRSKSGQNIDLDKLDRDYDALAESIFDAFIYHQRKLNQTSWNPTELGAKVLVVCRGQQDLEEMFKTKVFELLQAQHPDINIAALSSDFGVYYNGEREMPPVSNVKKHRLLKTIKALKPSDKLIVFHVDMIGEGIDVPGLTGVMPFRNCDLSKFIQNIGRTSRDHISDRLKLYAGEITTADRSKWIKPNSWVIIPTFLENSEGFASRFREIIETLRTDFGYVPKQHTVIDNVKGLDEDEAIDTVNDKEKNRPHSDSGLDEFEHEFEKMGPLERILFEDAIAQAKQRYTNEIADLLK